jgi:hypothetical protein
MENDEIVENFFLFDAPRFFGCSRSFGLENMACGFEKTTS